MTTYRELVNRRQAAFDTAVASGAISPFVFPADLAGHALIVLYLLLPPRYAQKLRVVLLPAALWLYARTMLRARSTSLANGMVIGLACSWCMVWAATLMLFNNVQRDFRRLERRSWREKKEEKRGVSSIPAANGLGEKLIDASDELEDYQLSWQAFPTSVGGRFSWAMELLVTLRGVGWSWQIAGLPPVPPPASRPKGAAARPAEVSLRRSLFNYIFSYLVLDALKVLLMRDPYFLGFIDEPVPPSFPRILRASPWLTETYRLAMTVTGIYMAILSAVSIAPLVFVGLGPRILGLKGERWMNPPQLGSFQAVLDHGLRGWWGQWWHQSFRFGFLSPGRWLVGQCRLDGRSSAAILIRLFTAFAISGFIHASATFTQFAVGTWPLGCFLFFVLQAVGIAGQSGCAYQAAGVISKLPKPVRQLSNVIVTLLWLRLTGPLLANEFARGGLWLAEPVPVSPLRGLGLGLEGEGWWSWTEPFARWYSAPVWWKSGIAL
ncbi:MAG: hypothetical protein M1829_006467 [Trizodia sp. TS-e1964]|nr:MAG: hypothetical protein M1829_006467 [Trizodia sp. TS-e1964]